MGRILGALVEAWEEIRINRMRLILSLVGVAVAVWAMATVLSIGSYISKAAELSQADFAGRSGTIGISANHMGDAPEGEDYENKLPFMFDPALTGESVQGENPLERMMEGPREDPFGQATKVMAEEAGANYWTRQLGFSMYLEAPGMPVCTGDQMNPFGGMMGEPGMMGEGSVEGEDDVEALGGGENVPASGGGPGAENGSEVGAENGAGPEAGGLEGTEPGMEAAGIAGPAGPFVGGDAGDPGDLGVGAGGIGTLENPADIGVANMDMLSFSSVPDYSAAQPGEVVLAAGACMDQTADIRGVDPNYFTIYGKRLIAGRLLTEADADLQMNPAVISEKLWNQMGRPNLELHPQVEMYGKNMPRFTVVGVIANASPFDMPLLTTPYDALVQVAPKTKLDTAEWKFNVMVPEGTEKANLKVIHSVVKGQLGKSWNVQDDWASSSNWAADNYNSGLTKAISIIGGIVILLGAFGLLTVSIITVQARVREIGIRRSMGASARRIFTSTFLESVVATTVAGVVGVIASILTIRFLPVNEILQLGIDTAEVGYPLSAAFLGVVISAGVGALCGIIPATIAVRIKPIDAIRF